MSTWTISQYTNEDLSQTINEAIELFINKMSNEGVVNEKTKDRMMNYRIVVYGSGFWGKIVGKMLGEEENSRYIRVINLEKK